jgi:hypothetical protein
VSTAFPQTHPVRLSSGASVTLTQAVGGFDLLIEAISASSVMVSAFAMIDRLRVPDLHPKIPASGNTH